MHPDPVPSHKLLFLTVFISTAASGKFTFFEMFLIFSFRLINVCQLTVVINTIYVCLFFPSLELIPHFISEPLSTVQKPGATIKLYCSAEPSTAHLSWIFNGEKLHKKIEQVDPQPGSLTIFSLSPSNSGTYQCVANNSIGAIISRPATVSVACKLYSD